MGLLNNLATSALSSLGVNTNPGVKNPSQFGPDFPKGMTITEVINGQLNTVDAINLVGRFAPLQPFEFGGEQRVVREEYPGSSEPAVHVLGPKEAEVTIRCSFKTNKFKDTSLRTKETSAAQEYQELIDAMRIRGNLVLIELGEWRRYGFIKATKFRLFTLQHIEADITFEITGFNRPKGWAIVNEGDYDPIKPNKEVTNKAAAALAAARNYPATMPLTAVDILNNAISSVATAVNSVTSFVDGIVDDADKLVAGANRAIGLIKNARATLSKAKRNISSISNNVMGLGSSFQNELQQFEALSKNPDFQKEKAKALIKNQSHISTTIGGMSSIAVLLAQLQKRFENYVSQVPYRRHLVREFDSLQTISMKFYGTADNWKAIYDHNKLKSTDLVVGSVLEIPRQ